MERRVVAAVWLVFLVGIPDIAADAARLRGAAEEHALPSDAQANEVNAQALLGVRAAEEEGNSRALWAVAIFAIVATASLLAVVHHNRHLNAQRIAAGEHAYRSLRECSAEEFERNKPFLIKRGVLNPGNVYLPERSPPPPNCKFATVVRNVAFFREGKWALSTAVGKAAVRYSRSHPLLVYHFGDPTDADTDDRLPSKHQVFVSEMCHDWWCDVPEDVPKKRYKDDASTMPGILSSVLYGGPAIPITVCGYYETQKYMGEHFLRVDPEHYDCHRMWRAEQNAYREFNWDIGWLLLANDCGSLHNLILHHYHNDTPLPTPHNHPHRAH